MRRKLRRRGRCKPNCARFGLRRRHGLRLLPAGGYRLAEPRWRRPRLGPLAEPWGWRRRSIRLRDLRLAL